MDGEPAAPADSRDGDEEFELLVFQLVEAKHPDAVRLVPPDGGADTVVPQSGDLTGGLPGEALPGRHGGRPLAAVRAVPDRAAEKHHPRRITFVFARDFTEPPWSAFKTRLVERQPEVAVEPSP